MSIGYAKVAFAAALVGLANPPAASTETADRLVATGEIDTSFDGIGAEQIEVTVNGSAATIDPNGEYALQVPVEPYYQVRISGPTIHPTIQTFGLSELFRASCDCLEIPPIDVVARKEGRIELFFAGDAMAGRRYIEPIWDERRLVEPKNPLPDLTTLLEPMKPYIETADLASVNLEIVLSNEDFGNSPPKSVVFFAPPALARALAEAGFDHVSLGNNHSYDYLDEGLAATIDAVEAAGLAWSGAGMDEGQALRASRLDIDGQPLALLGYVGWKGRVEPDQVASGDKGGAAHGSDENIAMTVAREAALGRHVIAQYHGSREYSEGPTEVSERRMKLAVDEGATLIASHHPHVPQGLELYNGALIAYSTGNFLFDQYFLETHGSFVLRAWMENGRIIRAEIVPIRVLDYRPVPAVGSMRAAILDRITRLSSQRGTRISRNAGHGLILAEENGGGPEAANKQPCPAPLDLLRSGDFENAYFGDASDRSLKVTGGTKSIVFAGREGHVLRLTGNRESPRISLTPSTFFRVVPGKVVTLSGRIRTGRDVVLEVASQVRPEDMGRMEALESAPVTIHGVRELTGGPAWQDFEITFRVGAGDLVRPFRPFLRVAFRDGTSVPGNVIDLDDLKVLVAGSHACDPS